MGDSVDAPYVGPRTFEEEEAHLFFGREREARDLHSLVLSERLVLFYAQSGAGKSSLINTRLRPGLRREGFEVLPVGRVSGDLPEDVTDLGNIFIFNLILSLDQNQSDTASFAQTRLSDYLRSHYPDSETGPSTPNDTARVLIIDQFEEILTTNLQHWRKREDFFIQLRQAINADPLLWVILSLREDYVAALDPYAKLLPGKLRTRFYMRRLGYAAALEAIEYPAEKGGRPFAEGVGQTLVDNLRRIRVYDGDETHLGEFVEPVQLQVVCYQLWENLKDQPLGQITKQDLQELGDVDTALAQFYEQAVARVLTEVEDLPEAYLRDWFEHRLITEAGTRGTVYRGTAKTGGLATQAADVLADQFLLRTEIRAGGIWYELVHDRFVNPILKSNQAWRLDQGLLEQLDHIVSIRLTDAEKTIEAGQTAFYELTLTNGGAMAAQFSVTVPDLEPGWLTIDKPTLTLEEGELSKVVIAITPPRLPSSEAGRHTFNLTVTSPDYPNRRSQREAILHIKPFYDFALRELAPRQQTISWFNRSGEAVVNIVNRGNAPTRFNIEGTDTGQNCIFEFQLPDEEVFLAQQAEVSGPADSTLSIPIKITPYSRHLIGFRPQRYDFTITATLLEGQQTSRTVLGQLNTKPLVGVWLLLLLSFSLICFLLLPVRPRLDTFIFTDGGQRAEITNGTPVAILWRASLFTTNLSIDPPIEGLLQPLPRQGTVVAFPKSDETYYLTGGNLLSDFAPGLFAPPPKSVQVKVVPIAPSVTFQADPNQVVSGEDEIVLNWVVDNADTIEIFRKIGDFGSLEPLGDFSDRPIGSLPVTPDPNRDMTFVLLASNAYVPTATPVSQLVTVVTPTPTVPPTPNIITFVANPRVINEGEASVLSWQVNGAPEVALQGVEGAFAMPPNFEISVQPTGSTDYILSATGVPPRAIRVNVTPVIAPEIEFFTIKPERVANSASFNVELAWSIAGQFTNIQLSSPHYQAISNLNREGRITLSVDQSTVFILTVTSKDEVNSQTVGIRIEGNNVSVIIPRATITPTIRETPTIIPPEPTTSATP